MPKKRCSHLTLGRKYVRPKKSKVDLETSEVTADWNTPIQIDIDDTNDESQDDENEGGEVIIDESSEEQHEKDIIDLFKVALRHIKEAGKFLFLWQFLHLIANGQFPFKSIIFTLFSEFIQWLCLASTTAMRYSEESKKFWWTGKMLFGSKFIRFMEGFKHKGFVASGDTQKGCYDPLKTTVNFAVPADPVLSAFCPFSGLEKYKNGVPPGIIQPTVEMYATHGEAKSHILTFDGKKVVPNSANINLIGCEDENTLKLQQILSEDENKIHEISGIIENLQESSINLITDLNLTDRGPLIQKLLSVFQHIGRRLEIVRELKNKKAYALSKLESKLDKLMTKDQFLMNHLKTYVYQCSNTIKDVTDNLNGLCELIAALNEAIQNFVKDKTVDLTLQGNFAELMPPRHVAESLGTDSQNIPTEYVKQRSAEWFEVRKSVKVTGSTVQKAVGIDSLKDQRSYFDETISRDENPKSDSQIEAMDYGSKNEINAVATLVGKIMPVLYPRLTMYEEGTYKLSDDSRPILCVSPDGSLRETNGCNRPLDNPAKVGIEIKCPFNSGPLKDRVFYTPPKRYISQCLLEQHALKSEQQLLISWSPETTTVLQIPENKTIVKGLLAEAKEIYYSDVPRRPTKLSDRTKHLSSQIDEHIKTCEFLGEFPSVTCVQNERKTVSEIKGTHRLGIPTTLNCSQVSVECACKTLLKSQSVIRAMMNLYDKKASEVVLFSIADSDRVWKKEIAHGLPIGYFTRGYSLSTDTMRNIETKMLTSCIEANIHVPCVTFDGQWYKLKDEAADRSPLTLFHMQRVFWGQVCTLSKDQILTKLCLVNRKVVRESEITTYDILPSMILKPVQRTIVLKSEGRPLKFPQCVISKPQTTPDTSASQDSDKTSEHKTVTDDDQLDELPSTEIDIHNENDDTPSNPAIIQYQMSEEDKTCIRTLLLRSKRKKNRFTPEIVESVDRFFENSSSVNLLTDSELKETIDYLNTRLKGTGKELSAKGSKAKKVLEICKLMGLPHETEQKEIRVRRHKKSPNSLQMITMAVLKKMDKTTLAAVYANYKWPDIEMEWRNKSSVGTEVSLYGTEYSFRPVYTPECVSIDGKKFLLVKCLDGHHIRTNIRSKICKDGTAELKRQAWVDVAKSKNTNLSIAMIDVNKDGKILDQQNDKYVRTMFSDEVEDELTLMGYSSEAKFTRLLREWYEAEDLPGISAEGRCKRALALREWLLKDYSFENFPPPGMHIKGFPKVTFEGLICSIEAHLYMYELCKSGTFNWRSVSTLVAENIFSEVTEMEHHNNGVPTGSSFQRNMAVMTGLHAIRLQPNRYVFVIFLQQNAFRLW